MVEGSAEYSLPMLGGETVIVKSYVVPSEDGTLKTYAYSENSTSGESGWVVEPLSGLTADDLVSANSSLDVSDLAEYGITFELAPEAVDINGTECYMLTSVIDVTTLETIMEKAADQLGEDISDISSVLYFLNGLKVNFVSYVDTATYLPVQNVIDMNDSDLSMINSLLGSYLGSLESGEAPATTYEVVLNDVSMTITPAFADVAEITVPDEALQAEASGEAYSLTDAASTVIE